jgi:ribosomal protein S18 acetylase RimI-like enzyme
MEKLPLSPPGYCLYQGTTRDRGLLVDFLQRTYSSLFPEKTSFSHLSQTVESYFSWRSPLWWVVPERDEEILLRDVKDFSPDGDPLGLMDQISSPDNFSDLTRSTPTPKPIAGLWLGNAVDQVTGNRHGHVFMLYVDPLHRRQGIATALMAQAQQWGKERGDQCLALQVFTHNQGAMRLYEKCGFTPHALVMQKNLI